MDKIVINAALQNTATIPDVALGRIIPLYVAEYQRITDSTYANQSYPIHLWNNVLASQQESHTTETYELQQTNRLVSKYACESMLMFQKDHCSIYTDTDADFNSWAEKEVIKMVDSGNIQSTTIEAYVCSSCEAVVSLQQPTKRLYCIGCGCCEVINTSTDVLLISTDERTSMDTLALSSNPKDLWVLGQSLRGVENRRYIVNKRRIGGISLKNVGFERDVLDPRIGLGLLSVYAALEEEAAGVDVIVGRAGLHLNTPQFVTAARSQLADYPQINMLGIVRAPSEYLMSLQDDGLDYQTIITRMFNRIIPHLMDMKRDLSPASAEMLIYSRKKQDLINKT